MPVHGASYDGTTRTAGVMSHKQKAKIQDTITATITVVNPPTGGSLYGLQDAILDAMPPHNIISIYSGVCGSPTASSPNDCKTACQDPSFIWSNPYAPFTVYNCILLSVLPALLSHGCINASFSSVEQFLPSFDVANANAVGECLASYCHKNHCNGVPQPGYCLQGMTKSDCVGPVSNGKIPDHTIVGVIPTDNLCSRTAIKEYFGQMRGLVRTAFNQLAKYSNICDRVPSIGLINGDLGGPGVFISYFMQSGLLILFWLIHLICDRGSQVFLKVMQFTKRRRLEEKDSKDPFAGVPSFAAWLRYCPTHVASICALVEFQKAQCFFVISVAIASLLALYGGSSYFFGAVSYASLDNTVFLLSLVASSGCISVTFGLFLVHTANMRSSFISILTTVATALSVTALQSVKRKNLLSIPINNHNPALHSCGGFSPVKFCTSTNPNPSSSTTMPVMSAPNRHFHAPFASNLDPDFTDNIKEGLSVTQTSGPFSLIVLCLLLLDTKFLTRGPQAIKDGEPDTSILDLLQKAIQRSKLWKTLNIMLNRRVSHLGRWGIHLNTWSLLRSSVKVACRLFIEGFFLFSFAQYVIFLSDFQSSGSRKGINTVWTLGQIIAVAVWIPIIIEWAYLAIRGVELGSRYRIARPYKVVLEKAGLSAAPTSSSEDSV